MVTPVEEADAGPGRLGGSLSHLSGNPRMRVWQLRALVAVIVMVAFSILVNWKLGLTLAVIVVIADTIYRARKGYAGTVRLTAAQRHTRRQLTKLRRAGYRAMHASPIPDSEDQIDQLVVGPAGVFAIDSEDWDKRLSVRTKSGRQLARAEQQEGPARARSVGGPAGRRPALRRAGHAGRRSPGNGGLRAEGPLGRGHHPGGRRLQRPAATQVPAPAGQERRHQAADRR